MGHILKASHFVWSAGLPGKVLFQHDFFWVKHSNLYWLTWCDLSDMFKGWPSPQKLRFNVCLLDVSESLCFKQLLSYYGVSQTWWMKKWKVSYLYLYMSWWHCFTSKIKLAVENTQFAFLSSPYLFKEKLYTFKTCFRHRDAHVLNSDSVHAFSSIRDSGDVFLKFHCVTFCPNIQRDKLFKLQENLPRDFQVGTNWNLEKHVGISLKLWETRKHMSGSQTQGSFFSPTQTIHYYFREIHQ